MTSYICTICKRIEGYPDSNQFNHREHVCDKCSEYMRSSDLEWLNCEYEDLREAMQVMQRGRPLGDIVGLQALSRCMSRLKRAEEGLTVAYMKGYADAEGKGVGTPRISLTQAFAELREVVGDGLDHIHDVDDFCRKARYGDEKAKLRDRYCELWEEFKKLDVRNAELRQALYAVLDQCDCHVGYGPMDAIVQIVNAALEGS